MKEPRSKIETGSREESDPPGTSPETDRPDSPGQQVAAEGGYARPIISRVAPKRSRGGTRSAAHSALLRRIHLSLPNRRSPPPGA
jgi:hypothetical protein